MKLLRASVAPATMLLSTAVNGPVFEGVRNAVTRCSSTTASGWRSASSTGTRWIGSSRESRAFRCAGEAVYPQRGLFPMSRMHSITRQPPHTGVFSGKMIIVNHMLDDYAWPNGAIFYADLVRAASWA